MSKTKPLGLIGSGKVTSSAFARLPGLTERLGPVKSHSLRFASRIANGIGAGNAVRRYEDLAHCRIVCIAVPDEEVPAVVTALASAAVHWDGKTVLLLDTWLDSSMLHPLARLGADTGSMCHAEAPAEGRCLVEGNRKALVEAKRLLHRGGFRVQTVEPHAKALVLAALTLAESLLFPLLSGAEECLRLGGVPPLQAVGFLNRAVTRASRSYGKSRRKAWSGALATGDAALLHRQIVAVAQADPRTARLLVACAVEALRYFSRDTSWIPQIS